MRKITATQKEELFTNHLPLAHKIAAIIAMRYGVPFDDMDTESVSLLELIVAGWDCPDSCFEYEPRRAGKRNPTGWIYFHLYTEMLTVIRKRRRHAKAVSFSVLAANGEDKACLDMPAKTSWVSTLLRDLGDDAKVLVQTILHAPAEVIEEMSPHPGSRTLAIKATRSYLAREGWDTSRISAAWGEVEACLA